MIPGFDRLRASVASRSGAFGVLTSQATGTLEALWKIFPDRLKRAFSPEHGYFGIAAAGEKTGGCIHPECKVPVLSLYGDKRKPDGAMLEGLDFVIVDLPDIGVRCYTYLATLKNMIEACAEHGKAVVVADRAVPLEGVVDGDGVVPGCESFVAPLDIPFCHGMSQGAAALAILEKCGIDADVEIVPAKDGAARGVPQAGFIPPSPAIRSWDSAIAYPMTVFTEAYPAVDCDRDGNLAFRVIGAPWLDAGAAIDALEKPLAECGVAMRRYRYSPRGGRFAGTLLDGILLEPADFGKYRPAKAGALLLKHLLEKHLAEMSADSKPEWMAKLMGRPPDWRAA